MFSISYSMTNLVDLKNASPSVVYRNKETNTKLKHDDDLTWT